MFCFKTIMKKYESNATEHCYATCHEVRFTSNQYLEKLDAEIVCKQHSSVEFNIAETLAAETTYGKNGYLHFTTRKLEEILINDDIEITNTTFDKHQMQMEHCRHLVVQDLARVTVMFESKKYVRTKTDKRVSFSESFGAFGKFLNLLYNVYS